MLESIDTSMVDWSRAVCLNCHVSLAICAANVGIGCYYGVNGTLYYVSGNEFWKRTAKFWMKLFGINLRWELLPD